jgi:hypothetical protein
MQYLHTFRITKIYATLKLYKTRESLWIITLYVKTESRSFFKKIYTPINQNKYFVCVSYYLKMAKLTKTFCDEWCADNKFYLLIGSHSYLVDILSQWYVWNKGVPVPLFRFLVLPDPPWNLTLLLHLIDDRRLELMLDWLAVSRTATLNLSRRPNFEPVRRRLHVPPNFGTRLVHMVSQTIPWLQE